MIGVMQEVKGAFKQRPIARILILGMCCFGKKVEGGVKLLNSLRSIALRPKFEDLMPGEFAYAGDTATRIRIDFCNVGGCGIGVEVWELAVESVDRASNSSKTHKFQKCSTVQK